MQGYDISKELYRTYKWIDPISGNMIEHRINKPITLFYASGHTTHRVVDSVGIVHCIPAVGYFGCVLYWENEDKTKPVNF